MKKSTIEFIKTMFYNELDGEYYNDFFDQKELDDYTIDLVEAAKDFFRNNTDWFANFALQEKLEEIGAENEIRPE